MIYTLILKPRFKNMLRVLAFVILVAFSATIYSCQTVYTEDYTPDRLKTDGDVKYVEVTTKSDSTINLTGYDVTYFEKYQDSSNILLLEKTDTALIKTESHKEYKITKKLSEINLKDVSKIKIEKTKFDLGETLKFTGITVLLIAIVGIIMVKKINNATIW